jgi:hypothetical protein
VAGPNHEFVLLGMSDLMLMLKIVTKLVQDLWVLLHGGDHPLRQLLTSAKSTSTPLNGALVQAEGMKVQWTIRKEYVPNQWNILVE